MVAAVNGLPSSQPAASSVATNQTALLLITTSYRKHEVVASFFRF